MVDKFKNILIKIIEAGTQVAFFGIFKMDDITDRWSVIFAADDVNADNRDRYFERINQIMKAELSAEEANLIARTGVFNSSSHLITLLLEFKEGHRIIDEKVNGNIIHDGYVFASNKAAQQQNGLFNQTKTTE